MPCNTKTPIHPTDRRPSCRYVPVPLTKLAHLQPNMLNTVLMPTISMDVLLDHLMQFGMARVLSCIPHRKLLKIFLIGSQSTFENILDSWLLHPRDHSLFSLFLTSSSMQNP